ncbi:hypothetical protein [Nisaea denitrificans]|uniref:hypothetical protein n=1 Tax=Nisaea denitrificans TaxID=390877 RepID=UPI00041F23E2|nr:hypothetical protein [Nisaea denitrificans]
MDPQKAEAQSFKDAVCEDVSDFYSRKSRDAIGRAAGRYLQSVRLTPMELLHSSRHQRAFSDAGTTLMQAVQKAAIAQVKGTNIPVSERVRRLYEITDSLYKEALEKHEKEPPEKLVKSMIPDVIALRDGESPSEQAFRIRAALTATLDGINDWIKKFETLYELGHDIAGLEAFGHFDSFIAEILRAPNISKEIFGELPTAGEEIDRLLALYDGDVEPSHAPGKPANAKKFYTLAKTGYIPETRDVLLRMLTLALNSSGRLTRGDLRTELERVRAIFKRLSTPNGFLGGEDCEIGLQKREASLLSDETIDLLLGGRIDVGEKVYLALQIRKQAISERGADYLSKYVTSIVGQPDFSRAVSGKEGSIEEKLGFLGKVHKETKANNLPPRIEDRICRTLEELQEELLENNDYFKKLETRPGSTAKKALIVIDLIGEGSLIGAATLKTARKSAHDFMKKADFLESYLADSDATQSKRARMQDLERRLKSAGLA